MDVMADLSWAETETKGPVPVVMSGGKRCRQAIPRIFWSGRRTADFAGKLASFLFSVNGKISIHGRTFLIFFPDSGFISASSSVSSSVSCIRAAFSLPGPVVFLRSQVEKKRERWGKDGRRRAEQGTKWSSQCLYPTDILRDFFQNRILKSSFSPDLYWEISGLEKRSEEKKAEKESGGFEKIPFREYITGWVCRKQEPAESVRCENGRRTSKSAR